MKILASKKTVLEFIAAVYPECTELAMAANTEEDILQEATRLILEREPACPPVENTKTVPMEMLDDIVKETQQRSGMTRRTWLPVEEVQNITARYGYTVTGSGKEEGR